MAFSLFGLLLCVYLLVYSGIPHSTDELLYLSLGQTLARGQPPNANEVTWMLGFDHVDGKYFLIALMLVPFNWLSTVLPQAGVYQTDLLLMPLVVAFTGALMFSGLQELGYTRAVSFLAALALGIASPLLVYSKYIFREPLAALGLAWLALSVVRLRKTLSAANVLAVAGSLLFSVAAKDTTFSAVPGLLLCFWLIIRRHRVPPQAQLISGKRLRWGLPIVIVLVVIVAVLLGVQTRVGAAVISLVGSGNPLGGSLDKGLTGLLISPGRGLFWYAPILFIAFAAFPHFFKKYPIEAVLIMTVSLASLFLHAAYATWWGGFGWGPRFLVPIIPLWCFPLAEAFKRGAQVIKNARARISRASLFRLALPGLIVSICGLSTGIQLLGAGIAFDKYESYLETSKGHLAALRASGDINYIFNYTPFMIDAVLLKPANLDFVWIRARQRADYLSVQTSLVASLVLGAGWFAASAWLLDRVTRQRDLLVVGCASLLAVGWSSANLLAVAYADERYPSANYQAAAQWLSQEALPGDGLLLELQVRNWFQTASYFLNYLREPNLAMYSLGRPVEQISTAQVAEQLRPLVTRHHSLWLHVESTPPGDPANQFERWLTNNEFLLSCEWFNQYSRLCLYSVDRQSGTTRIDLNVLEGTQIRLVGAVIGADSDSAHPLITHPGADIQLAMNWTALDSVHHAYKVFIQLIDAGGKLRQQIDREPVNSFRPTNRWTAGDEIQDRYAMRLGGLEPGQYRIIAGLYDAETIVRLPVRDAQGQLLGDFVDLAVLDVR